jgi:putative membrane protein
MTGSIIPYCGVAPIPGSVTWNLDPILILCLAGLVAAHLWLARTEQPWRTNAALAGWAVVAIALISPLCNLSVALFSARVGQHMIITLVGAPLIAMALPRRSAPLTELWAATAIFTVALWTWHSPLPYAATFSSTPVYWLMHLTLFSSALWLWWTLLGTHDRPWPALGASFVTTLQMSLLGALLAFSPRPLFAAHLFSSPAWNLSPLEDQQLGGLIMWIPAGILLMSYALLTFGQELSRLSRRTQLVVAYSAAMPQRPASHLIEARKRTRRAVLRVV